MSSLLRLTGGVLLSLGVTCAQADTINLDLSSAVFTGGAGFIAGDSKIKFDPNVINETATFTIPSVVGTQYSISVTGQSNSSTSFVQFLIDADGPGPGGFTQVGTNVNFGSGFNTITLPAFTDLGPTDFLRIINGGTGNTEAQISAISLNAAAVPGPVVGAGLPGMVMALGGFGVWWRRRKSVAGAA